MTDFLIDTASTLIAFLLAWLVIEYVIPKVRRWLRLRGN